MEQLQIDEEILNAIGKIEPERSLDRSILRLLESEVIKRIGRELRNICRKERKK